MSAATTAERLLLWSLSLAVAGCGGHGKATAPSPTASASTVPPSPEPAGWTNPPPEAASPSSPPLASEAGFFDLPPQPTAATYAARMFYVFRPADDDAARKPLAVFMNGGPGYATSLGLLAYGTGPMTLRATSPGAMPAANPASWSAFANLLYLDQRMAGFSYGLGASALPPCTMEETEDAADFVRALLAFLDGHEALRGARVVLVGESYSGVRVTRALDLLLRYGARAALGGDDLPGLVQAHYDRVFPDRAGSPLDEATASRQFGAQVLLQPVVLGSVQWTAQEALLPSDPYVGAVSAAVDPYDVRQDPSYSLRVDQAAIAAMSDPTAAALLLGAPLASVPRLSPADRDGAFHPTTQSVDGVDAANAALSQLLGAVGPNDAYLAQLGDECPTPAEWIEPTVADVFADNLRWVRTFISDARYDSVVYAPAIPAVFAQSHLGGAVDAAPRPGVARPGWFTVALPARGGDRPEPAATVEVRFPSYDASGHFVAVGQPEELASDVRAFLAE